MSGNHEFNYKLCEERHDFIGKGFAEMKDRLKRVENRAWLIMALLVSNLACAILILMFK